MNARAVLACALASIAVMLSVFAAPASAGTAAGLVQLPVLDALNRNENPLSNGGKWTALNWAAGTKKAGQDTNGGWGTNDTYPTVNGAYWNSTTFSDRSTDAAATTTQMLFGLAGQSASLWLNMSSPDSAKSGYELRWTFVSGSTFSVKLSKWSAGAETVLASNASVSIPSGTTLAISDTGGTVGAWKMPSGGSFSSLLAATDSTYNSGYAGIEGSGTGTRLTNFKAGSLLSYKLANLSTIDQLDRSEEPLSNGGKWTALNWAAGTKKTGKDTSEGWAPVDSYPTVNGAFWSPGALSDTSGWDAASLSMQKSPTTYDHSTSIWLNMPNPGSAKSGYALNWRMNLDTATYTAALEKWASGTRTVLDWAYFNIPAGTTMALVDEGGTVSAWMGSGGALEKILSASDTTYNSGYAGIDGSGTVSRMGSFRAGTAADSPDEPETTISAGSSTGIAPPNVAFSFSSTDSGAGFECSLDGGSYAACGSPKSYAGLGEATHVFRVRATGAAGTDQTPAERSVQVLSAEKSIARTPLLDALQRSEWPMSTSTFSKPFWAPEKGAIWAHDGYDGWGSNENGAAAAYWNPTPLSDAEGAVLASATIGSAGVSWGGERASLWLNMPNPGNAKSGYEARFEAGSSAVKAELAKWVAGTRTILASQASVSLPIGTTMALSESGGNLTLWSGSAGSFSQVVSANDSAYGSGYAGMEVSGVGPKEHHFKAGTIDLVAPETTIVSGPSGKVAAEKVLFSQSSSEANSSFECSIDGGAYSACGATKEYTGLAEASHTYRVRAVDPAGNVDPTPAERTFTVFQPPNTTIVSATPTYTSHEEWPVEFASNKAGSTFKCSLDGANPPTKACTTPYELTKGLAAGWHTFVVMAVDKDGNADPTPAVWTFNPDIYQPAPASSKLTSPEEGRATGHYFTLTSKWGSEPEGGGVSGVTYQIKLPYWKEFKTIPAKYVLDGVGQPVKWPLVVSANPGHAEPVFFDYRGAAKGSGWPLVEEDIKLRAVFDGGKNAAGASEPVSLEYSGNNSGVGAPTDAATKVGPASLDLLTGQYTLNVTDVSIPIPGTEASLEFTRSYESNYRNQKVNSMVLGGMWQPSAPVEQAYEGEAWQTLYERHQNAVPAQYDGECLKEWEEEAGAFPKDECMVEDAIPASDWIELIDSEGGEADFEISGGNYVTPEYMKEYVLTKVGETFELADPDGVHTVFTKNEVGVVGSYRPTSVSWQAGAKTSRLVYEHLEGTGQLRLAKMIAPAPAGVTCSDSAATKTPGCRVLTFQYSSCSCEGWSRLDSITYYNSSGNEAQKQEVARYQYDSHYRLIAEWDPRISPALKEQYGYGAWFSTLQYQILSLALPGEEPWEFAYESSEARRLLSVSRASLLSSPSKATTTIVYGVPLSGEGAPYDMSPKRVAEWGQADYPVDATAIFPPTEVPSSPPSDYAEATVHYMDPEGYEVNTAAAAPPGVEGVAITTAETDMHGNVIRELGAQNRLQALKAEDPVARSRELDSHSVYSEDGTKMLESWGPLHKVRLESGEAVEAREHTQVVYDDGFVAKEGETTPRLPTRETIGASIPGEAEDADRSVTETKYDWGLRKPTEAIVDPAGLNLVTKTVYNAAGQIKEERQPSDTAGASAGTTRTVYYTAAANAEIGSCGNKPAWAGLPCLIYPIAAPSPAGTRPPMPATWFTGYTSSDQPTEIEEKTNGVTKRSYLMTYDLAGRLVKTRQVGEGAELKPMETVYDEASGRPFEQRLVCESSCSGFDSQATKSTYDTLGRIEKYEDADGNLAETTYDLLGRPVATSDDKGSQAMAYDPASGALTKLEDSGAGAFSAVYDADGNLIEELLPNGVAARTAFDPTGAAVSLEYKKASGCASSCTWLDFDDEYSIAGQVLREQSTLSTDAYAYDKAGRLVRAAETPTGEGCTTRAYAYDKDSNRSSLTTRAPKPGGACDTESAGTKQSYGYDSADRLIDEGVAYDSLGRITSLPGKDAGGATLATSYYVNDMIATQSQGEYTNSYLLDSMGRPRQLVKEKGTKETTETFHYDSDADSPVWTEDSTGNWTRNILGVGTELAAIEDSKAEETTLQLADLHGDIVATASLSPSATGPTATFRYDEFGNPKSGSAGRYGWLGGKLRRTELPSGVVQMGVRSYVPAVGRFISPDPVRGGSANSYDYADADPVNGLDLEGTISEKSIRNRIRRARSRERHFRHMLRVAGRTERQMHRIVLRTPKASVAIARLKKAGAKFFREVKQDFGAFPRWAPACRSGYGAALGDPRRSYRVKYTGAIYKCMSEVISAMSREEKTEKSEVRESAEERYPEFFN